MHNRKLYQQFPSECLPRSGQNLQAVEAYCSSASSVRSLRSTADRSTCRDESGEKQRLSNVSFQFCFIHFTYYGCQSTFCKLSGNIHALRTG